MHRTLLCTPACCDFNQHSYLTSVFEEDTSLLLKFAAPLMLLILITQNINECTLQKDRRGTESSRQIPLYAVNSLNSQLTHSRSLTVWRHLICLFCTTHQILRMGSPLWLFWKWNSSNFPLITFCMLIHLIQFFTSCHTYMAFFSFKIQLVLRKSKSLGFLRP